MTARTARSSRRREPRRGKGVPGRNSPALDLAEIVMPAIESAPGSSSAEGPFMRMYPGPSGRKWREVRSYRAPISSARVTTAFASKKECARPGAGTPTIRKPSSRSPCGESRPFVARLGEDDAKVRLHDFKRDAGKARTVPMSTSGEGCRCVLAKARSPRSA